MEECSVVCLDYYFGLSEKKLLKVIIYKLVNKVVFI